MLDEVDKHDEVQEQCENVFGYYIVCGYTKLFPVDLHVDYCINTQVGKASKLKCRCDKLQLNFPS